MRETEADVLVVGGGLAALRSAYEARRAGARVTIAVKGRLGRSGSSAMTSAGYSAVIDPSDAPSLHTDDTLTGGRGLSDPVLVGIMAAEAPARREELVALGGKLALDGDGRYVVHPSGDHTIARTVVAESFRGLDLTLPLAAEVERIGCEVLERTMVLDVLADADGVVGAVGLQRGEGLVAIRAGAVILAAGGCGQLFSTSSNPSDVTGDGYAIALRAGAALRDMEFIQFYPWRCVDPFVQGRMPIQPSTFTMGARLLNARGERFMADWDPDKLDAAPRDVSARGIYEQIRQGVDVRGGVLLDLTRVSDADWLRSNPRPAAWFEKRGASFRDTEMIIAPEAHFFMGGVVTDEHGRASVPGLYAAGENAGGVHGANRLDSNAIPETQVFGARAGRDAAAHAQVRDHRTALDAWLAARPPEPSATADFTALRRELQRTAWSDLGIVRDESRLRRGLDAVHRLVAAVDAVGPLHDRDRAELLNLLLVGTCCFTSALQRTESRGAHFRIDHPDRDDARWRRVLTVTGATPDVVGAR